MIDKVFLITGGEAHTSAYNFLKKNKYNFEILDDNQNCYLKKKYKIKRISKLSLLRKKIKKNCFLWSPCNDYGAYLADKYNSKNFKKRINDFNYIHDKFLQFQKLDINSLFENKISKNKLYLKKKRFGSGSRGISFYKERKPLKSQNYFIQEYLKGIELSLETLSFNSKHRLLNISYRILKNYKSACIIYSKNFKPIINKFFEKEIIKILNKLKIRNGICHIEVILTESKKLFPIDLNIRTGGAGISDQLLPYVFKSDVNKIDFEILSNKIKSHNLIRLKRNFNLAALIYDYKTNFHIKKRLKNYKKIGKYTLFNKNIKFNKEIDRNRTSSLFIKSKSVFAFQKKLKKILVNDFYYSTISIEEKLMKIINN